MPDYRLAPLRLLRRVFLTLLPARDPVPAPERWAGYYVASRDWPAFESGLTVDDIAGVFDEARRIAADQSPNGSIET